MATIQEIADLIRTLRVEEREALAHNLATIGGTRAQCPAKHDETGARCELDEDHPGGHTAVARVHWLIAMKCRIGASHVGLPICDRIEGHDGPCVPVAPKQRPKPVEEGFGDDAWSCMQHPKGKKGCAYCRRNSIRANTKGCTYFAQAASGGAVKIGFTRRDPEVRIKELAGPEPMVLLASLPGNVETDLHLILAASRKHGEWFEPTPEVMAEVEKARKKSPVTST